MTDITFTKYIVQFNGFAEGSVTAGEAPDVGQIVFLSNLNVFTAAYLPLAPNPTPVYYVEWDGSDDFYDGNNNIRQDILFKNTVNNEHYHWTGTSLKLAGGIVAVDNNTLSQSDGVARIADNPKTSGNSVGDILVTGSSLPTPLQEKTRYNIYNNITTGTTTIDNTEVIQLPAGSKIVPKGGMPLVPVTGGEMSWVHSSDIGMIQDDETLTDVHRQTRGAQNAAILRNLVNTRYNLILDGTYYIYLPRIGSSTASTGIEGQQNCKNSAITLERELQIQGGGLVVYCYLFYITNGGGIKCDGVTFNHLDYYHMFGVFPDGSVLSAVEMHNCVFKGKSRFICGSSMNIPPSDQPDMMRVFNPSNCKTYLGLTGDSRYKEYSGWLYIYPEGVSAPSSYTQLSLTDCFCRYTIYSTMYVPQSGGEYVFKLDASSSIKHMGNLGMFILTSELETGDITDGNTYTTMKVRDTMESGVILRNTITPVDRQGIERFILDGCSTYGGGAVTLDGIAVYEEYRINNCIIDNVSARGLSFGSDNDRETSDEWGTRSAPLYIEDCVFRGKQGIFTEDAPYHCAVLAETDTVHFCRNLIENFISTTNTYDVYLSANNVEYIDNVVRNVLPFKPTTTSKINYGYGKAKQVKLSKADREANAGYASDPVKRISRVYERNIFSVSIKEVREKCASYIASHMPDRDIDDVLEERVLFTEMQNVVADWGMEEFIFRNNTFDMPQCKVTAVAVSNGCVIVRKYVMENNVMKFKSFPSTPTYGYWAYMFGVEQLSDESTTVSICNNIFISVAGGEMMNLLTLNRKYPLASLRVEDNKFVNCGYRIVNRYRQGDSPSDWFDGEVVAAELSIRGNKEAAGLDTGYTDLYSVSGNSASMFGLNGIPIMFRGGDVELWDSQLPGVAANTNKYILLPNDSSTITICSTHLCRPMSLDANNKPVKETNKCLGLIHGLPLRKKSSLVSVRYRLHGVWKERKLEFRCVTGGTILSSTGLALSVRGVDGRRIAQHETNNTYKFFVLAEIEELGLKFHATSKYVFSNTSVSRTSYIRLLIYTSDFGTLNDSGTEITIKVTDIPEADWITSNDTINYTGTSPMSSFITPGSLMSEAERTALLTGDFAQYGNGSSGTARCTLRSTDAGFWVLDSSSYQIVVWNGYQWV